MSAWVGLISGMHGMIALMRQEGHWLLNDADAQVYGKALGNAMRHLPIGVAQKYVDFSALIMVAIQMDAPRVMLSAGRRKEAKAQQAKPKPTVYPLHVPPPVEMPLAPGGASAADQAWQPA